MDLEIANEEECEWEANENGNDEGRKKKQKVVLHLGHPLQSEPWCKINLVPCLFHLNEDVRDLKTTSSQGIVRPIS